MTRVIDTSGDGRGGTGGGSGVDAMASESTQVALLGLAYDDDWVSLRASAGLENSTVSHLNGFRMLFSSLRTDVAAWRKRLAPKRY